MYWCVGDTLARGTDLSKIYTYCRKQAPGRYFIDLHHLPETSDTFSVRTAASVASFRGSEPAQIAHVVSLIPFDWNWFSFYQNTCSLNPDLVHRLTPKEKHGSNP